MKYENKVKKIYQDILDNTTKDKLNFVKSLSDFLNDIQRKKVNGDKLAHVGFQNIVFNGYGNVRKFLLEYLGALKYLSYFNSLYQAKKNEEITHSMKVIKNIDERFDFYSFLNDFVV